MLKLTTAIVCVTLVAYVQCQNMMEMMLMHNLLGGANRANPSTSGSPALTVPASGTGLLGSAARSPGSTSTGVDLASLLQPGGGSNSNLQNNVRNLMLMGLSMDQLMEFYACARVGMPMVMCMQNVQ